MPIKQPIPGTGTFPLLGPYDPQNMLDNSLNTDVASQLQSPEKEKKKARKKTKKDKTIDMENVETILETFNQQLKQLPPVPLMEPYVGHSYAICTLAGASSNING